MFEEALEIVKNRQPERSQQEIYDRCEFDWEEISDPSDAPIQW